MSLKRFFVALLFVSFASHSLWAQTGVSTVAPAAGDLSDVNRLDPSNSISSSDFQKLRETAAFKKQLEKNDAKRAEKFHQETIAFTAKEISSLGLSCQVEDAQLIGRSSDKKAKDVKSLYEVSCSNHLGYLLITQADTPTHSSSCFAAEATRTADLASGVDSLLYCQMPANQTVNLSAQKILADLKAECEVDKVQWYGQNTNSHFELTEVSCKNNQGYLLKTGLAGNALQPSIQTCVESAKQGLACRLTATKVVPIESIAAALLKNGLKCDPENIHVFGREKLRKRHVVEALCEGKASSLVAFVPLEDSTTPFESETCEEASKSGINCKLHK